MVEKRKYKSINVSEKSFQELTFISKVLNKSLVGFISELSSALMSEAFQFQVGKANIEYSQNENSDIVISFSGSTNFTFGSETETEETQRLRKLTEGY